MNKGILAIGLIVTLAAGCSSAGASSFDAVPVIETGVDPESWAIVPAGSFLSGQHEHEAQIDHDYEIMVTDVTNAQYAAYLTAALEAGWVRKTGDEIVGYYPGDVFRGFEHEEEIAAGDWQHIPLADPGLRIEETVDGFRSLPGYENHPMVQVTWFGARSYCEFYGGRLPSELEWEKAARGEDNRPYPWGWEIELNNANFYSSTDIFEKTFGKAGNTTPVGYYNGQTYDDHVTLDSPSLYGLYDMAGNVWQWTGDVYEDQHYRYMRGGSKADYGYNLRIWTRNNAAPQYFSPSVGFRCVRDPQE
jgi:formylglycine-generating enzyme required for sulfatase activity